MAGGFAGVKKRREKTKPTTLDSKPGLLIHSAARRHDTAHTELSLAGGRGLRGGEMGLVFLPSQAPLANSFFSPPPGRAT